MGVKKKRLTTPEIGCFYVYCVSLKIGRNNQTLGVSLQYMPGTPRSELPPHHRCFNTGIFPEQGTRQTAYTWVGFSLRLPRSS